MDERDVALAGVEALAGTLTAFGPVGGAMALLGLSLAGVLSVHAGARTSAPQLTGAEVDHIIAANLLKQDVRDGWALIRPTHDWYREWTIRAASGEEFTAADMKEFDTGYAHARGPNSAIRQGLVKLFPGKGNRDSTPGQYGVPYVILGVGVWVGLLELDLVRTHERGEKISGGQWDTFDRELETWGVAIQRCDQLAAQRVEEEVRAAIAREPQRYKFEPARAKDWYSELFKEPRVPGGPNKALLELIGRLERRYRGGFRAEGVLPALTAAGELAQLRISLETARRRLAAVH
ncbi:MAG TPA: hypothetical protein VNS09_05375 [Solirubrobacter sp.]|nr:hypothetical protein [Solirubrobacter sp.]